MPRSDRLTRTQRWPGRRYVMSESPSSPTRRTLLTAATAAGAATIIPPATIPPAAHAAAGAAKDDVRPFQVQFPDAALTDLRRRVAATKGPSPNNRSIFLGPECQKYPPIKAYSRAYRSGNLGSSPNW